NARLLFHDAVHQCLRRRHARFVINRRVAEITNGIRQGPETDFAGGKRVRDLQRHRQGIVQAAIDLNAYTLDGQRVPDTDGDVSAQGEGVHKLPVDHFVKPQVVPQRAGADDVKVRRVLETEH